MEQSSDQESQSRRWQIGIGLLIALGCLATASYTVIETFWG
jgi:hypothetical protein